jgi:hypothetical protein
MISGYNFGKNIFVTAFSIAIKRYHLHDLGDFYVINEGIFLLYTKL